MTGAGRNTYVWGRIDGLRLSCDASLEVGVAISNFANFQREVVCGGLPGTIRGKRAVTALSVALTLSGLADSVSCP